MPKSRISRAQQDHDTAYAKWDGHRGHCAKCTSWTGMTGDLQRLCYEGTVLYKTYKQCEHDAYPKKLGID